MQRQTFSICLFYVHLLPTGSKQCLPCVLGEPSPWPRRDSGRAGHWAGGMRALVNEFIPLIITHSDMVQDCTLCIYLYVFIQMFTYSNSLPEAAIFMFECGISSIYFLLIIHSFKYMYFLLIIHSFKYMYFLLIIHSFKYMYLIRCFLLYIFT